MKIVQLLCSILSELSSRYHWSHPRFLAERTYLCFQKKKKKKKKISRGKHSTKIAATAQFRTYIPCLFSNSPRFVSPEKASRRSESHSVPKSSIFRHTNAQRGHKTGVGEGTKEQEQTSDELKISLHPTPPPARKAVSMLGQPSSSGQREGAFFQFHPFSLRPSHSPCWYFRLKGSGQFEIFKKLILFFGGVVLNGSLKS